MYIVSSDEMKRIDSYAINKYKIPGIVLMENAARAVFNRINELGAKRVLILCGGGNNGGDGFALARLLFTSGYDVKLYCFKEISKITGDAAINLEVLINIGIEIKSSLENLEEDILNSSIVVDALLGTGIKGRVSETYKKVIEMINSYSSYTLSIDIPSGIDSNTGKKLGDCVYANETVTFECMKYGHLLLEGRIASGKVYVNGISIPKECIEEQEISSYSNYKDYPINLLKLRRKDTYKGDYGRVYIVGGSFNMSGAVILSARAAMRSGCGLVTCVIPKSITDRVGSCAIESTYMPLDEIDGLINPSMDDIDKILNRADAIAVGPGLGRADHLKSIVKYMLENYNGTMVIDADGLNMIKDEKQCLIKSKAKIVLTPHLGEMAGLTGLDMDYINENRVDVSKEFAEKYGCILLLKGSSTVVTDGKRTYINTTGNPGMASGGSGDVLTGITASFLAQGYEPYNAAVLSSYIHGLAGDRAYEKYGAGLIAGDIINFMGESLKM